MCKKFSQVTQWGVRGLKNKLILLLSLLNLSIYLFNFNFITHNCYNKEKNSHFVQNLVLLGPRETDKVWF